MVMMLRFDMGFLLMVMQYGSSSQANRRLWLVGRSDRHRATSGHQPYVVIIAVDGANVNDGSIGLRTPLQGTVATNNWEAHALAATVGWQSRNEAHQFRRSAPTA